MAKATKSDIEFSYTQEIELREEAIVRLIKDGQYLYDMLAECSDKETTGMSRWRKAVNVALRFPGVKIT